MIDDSVIAKTKPYLEPLLEMHVISNEQADAVITLIACNEKGSMCLLGDEPGLGKTRTLMVYLLIQHNLTEQEGSLLFLAPNGRILDGQEADRQAVINAFATIDGVKVPQIKALYKLKAVTPVEINTLYLQTIEKLNDQLGSMTLKAIVIDEVHKASKAVSKSKNPEAAKIKPSVLSRCIQKVTGGDACRAVFSSATSITNANSEILSFWDETSDSKMMSIIDAQATIARLHNEGKLVVRALDLPVNLEVKQLKRMSAQSPLDMLAEAASPEQRDLTSIQREIERLRKLYTLLNSNGDKSLNLRFSSYIKRLIEEEKLITLILNLNKEVAKHRHAIYVEGVGDFSQTKKSIFEQCQAVLEGLTDASQEEHKVLSHSTTLTLYASRPERVIA